MKTSVAMCTYNGESYLDEQLQSILEQTEPIDEIVICDDGSIDKTLSIIEKFIKAGTPIRLILNQKNLGYTRNFEKAICLCSGDIIFLADQDDIWMPEKVKKVCDYFVTHPDKSFIFTNGQVVNSMGMPSYEKTLFDIVGMTERNKQLFDQGHHYDVMCVSSKVTGATTALRASFVPYCLPFPELNKLAIHDGMMAASAAIRNQIGYIDECLIKYREHRAQSVGLGTLFKFPPSRYELTNDLLMWHEALTDPYNKGQRERLRFVYRRLLSIRSIPGIFNLIGMYIRGDYRRQYSHPFAVFLRDIKGVAVRFAGRAARITHYRFVDPNDI